MLGANGTMGYGSAALFTQAVPEVTFLARTARRPRRASAPPSSRCARPRSSRSDVGSYDDDLERRSPRPTSSSRR